MTIPTHVIKQLRALYQSGITDPRQLSFMLRLSVEAVERELAKFTENPACLSSSSAPSKSENTAISKPASGSESGS